MTLLAGAYSRNPGDVIPPSLAMSLEGALSRHPVESIERFRDDRCLLVKADIGAFGAPARIVDASGASFMTGEPLLATPARARRPRDADLMALHSALPRDDESLLRSARGVFSLAHYDVGAGRLLLVTDKLGIRPLYVSVGERHVVFASALRILEHLDEVPKTMDLRGVTEMAAFGYPLADRTAYESIRLLMPGEIMEMRDAEIRLRRYWRWDDIAPSDLSLDELASRSYACFTEAVALRNGADRTTAAFLSGGLDSRAIVGALRDRDIAVRTFNFALPGTQDQVFGADFARRVGVTHVEAPMKPAHPAWSLMMAQALAEFPEPDDRHAERPRVVWSGDGGSVAIGHVYLTPALVAQARSGDVPALVESMNRSWGGEVPRRLMRPAWADQLAGLTRCGLAEELNRITAGDRGRALHLLLMYNDQRRHLTEHFEGIDLHRLEFELPFFDSDFVASVLEVPVDACLGHGFYMRWMRCFPEVLMSVPWQAYPGHEPCSLPAPPALRYQWEHARSRPIREALKKKLVTEASELLHARDFPEAMMSRHFLRLAALLYRLDLRDLGHIIRTATTYHRYWSRSGGRVGSVRASRE